MAGPSPLVPALLLLLALAPALGGAAGGVRLHFAIAAAPGAQAQGFGRAFNRTLANITAGHAAAGYGKFAYNFTLDVLVIDLPENGSFSSGLLENVCALFAGKRVVAVLIIGSSPAAFTVSLTAKHAGIPVLWAKGQGSLSPGLRGLDGGPLEVRLAAAGGELVQALRGLLLHAHWHTYTLLADATTASELRRPELWASLRQAPLHPTLVPLPTPLRAQSLFRKLADISRSTRGVVVLLSSRRSAVRILDDARRLNMMDGDFVWIWIDTSEQMHPRDVTEEPGPPMGDRAKHQATPSVGDRAKRATVSAEDEVPDSARGYREDLEDMRVEYLLRNDRYLLFNRDGGDVRREWGRSKRGAKDFYYIGFDESRSDARSDLPAGLLSLKPLPVKVDRHLVKGAVRLLVATLKLVLTRSPPWVIQSLVAKKSLASCWRDVQRDQNGFAADYGRFFGVRTTEHWFATKDKDMELVHRLVGGGTSALGLSQGRCRIVRKLSSSASARNS